VDENGVNLKVAVLTEKVNNVDEKIDKMEDILLHKFRTQESQIKFMYDEVMDIQNKLKHFAIAAGVLFFLVQGGLVDFLKSLM